MSSSKRAQQVKEKEFALEEGEESNNCDGDVETRNCIDAPLSSPAHKSGRNNANKGSSSVRVEYNNATYRKLLEKRARSYWRQGRFWKKKYAFKPSLRKVVQDLQKQLNVAVELLLDCLFTSLSSNNNNDNNTCGLTLPASAVGWLSMQLVRTENGSNAHFSTTVTDIDDNMRRHALTVSTRHRWNLVKYLLPRVTHVRIVNEPWPIKEKSKRVIIHDEQSASEEHGLEDEEEEYDDNKENRIDVSALRSSVDNDMDDFTQLCNFIQMYDTLRLAPSVDMRVFPKCKVLVLDGVLGTLVTNLHSLSNTLQVLRVERSSLGNVPRFLGTSLSPKRKPTNNNDILSSIHNDNVPWLEYSKLSHVKLSYCALGEFSGLRQGQQRRRKRSQSSENTSNSIQQPPLAALSRVESLCMSHNELASENSALSGLEKLSYLQHLDFSFNILSSLQHAHHHLGNIRVLNLSHNRINTVSGIDRLYALEELYLHNNNLSTVAGLAQLVQLRELTLYNNPISTNVTTAKYRVDLLNLFKDQRMRTAFLPLTASRRDWQAILPRLDGQTATIDELRALQGRTYEPIKITLLDNNQQFYDNNDTNNGTIENNAEPSATNDDITEETFDRFEEAAEADIVTSEDSIVNSQEGVSSSFLSFSESNKRIKTRKRRRRRFISDDSNGVVTSSPSATCSPSVEVSRKLPNVSFSASDVIKSIQVFVVNEKQGTNTDDIVDDTEISALHIDEEEFRESNQERDSVENEVNIAPSLDDNIIVDANDSPKPILNGHSPTNNSHSAFDEAIRNFAERFSSSHASDVHEEDRQEDADSEQKLESDEFIPVVEVENRNKATSSSSSIDKVTSGRCLTPSNELIDPTNFETCGLSPITQEISVDKIEEFSQPADTNGEEKAVSTTDIVQQSKIGDLSQEELKYDEAVTPKPIHNGNLSSDGESSESPTSATQPSAAQLGLRVVSYPDQSWLDDQSVVSSVTSTMRMDSTTSVYQLAEEKSTFEGPVGYHKLLILEQLELYFRMFVFSNILNIPQSYSSMQSIKSDDNDEDEDWQAILRQFPRIQLWPLDWRTREATDSHNIKSVAKVDSREEFRRVWKERLIACGKPALKRLTPNRTTRFGFHGELLWSAVNTSHLQPDIVSECREVILCLSDTSFYIILDHDAVTQKAKDQIRRFPLPIAENAVFKDAVWPHALARHPLTTLRAITIGFGFQRLTLRFSNSTIPGLDDFTYILMTGNKLQTITLLKELQTLVNESRNATGNADHSSDAIAIDNDDQQVLVAISEAVAPESIGIIVHYQILQQRWKHGDRGAVRRVCVITDGKIFLLDEDYNGDGSELRTENRLGHTRYRLVDSSDLLQVSHIHAADSEPNAITIVIKPLSRLQRTRNWRLTCRDRDGAERLVEDLRKAKNMS